jgi:hypothetical protein
MSSYTILHYRYARELTIFLLCYLSHLQSIHKKEPRSMQKMHMLLSIFKPDEKQD